MVDAVLPFIKRVKWYHVTRALGVSALIFGLLVDHTADRGTIILGAFALLGVEPVARSEKKG